MIKVIGAIIFLMGLMYAVIPRFLLSCTFRFFHYGDEIKKKFSEGVVPRMRFTGTCLVVGGLMVLLFCK